MRETEARDEITEVHQDWKDVEVVGLTPRKEGIGKEKDQKTGLPGRKGKMKKMI